MNQRDIPYHIAAIAIASYGLLIAQSLLLTVIAVVFVYWLKATQDSARDYNEFRETYLKFEAKKLAALEAIAEETRSNQEDTRQNQPSIQL